MNQGVRHQVTDSRPTNDDMKAILSIADPRAVVAAVVAFVILVWPLGFGWLLSLVLAVGVYAGSRLLMPQQENQQKPTGVIETKESSREEIAYEEARSDAASMREAIERVPRASTRKCLSALTDEIDKMLAVIDEDTDRGSMLVAPGYYSRLVKPFWAYLNKALRLHARGVNGADTFLARIETTVCPKTLAVSQDFYQQYHQQEVLDLATLNEILEHLLDTFDQTSSFEDVDNDR